MTKPVRCPKPAAIIIALVALTGTVLLFIATSPPKPKPQSPYEIGWTMGHAAAGVEAGTVSKDKLGAFREWWLTQSNASAEFTSNVNAGYKVGYREGRGK